MSDDTIPPINPKALQTSWAKALREGHSVWSLTWYTWRQFTGADFEQLAPPPDPSEYFEDMYWLKQETEKFSRRLRDIYSLFDVRVIVDPTLQAGEIQLRDGEGNVLARITNAGGE